MLCRNTSTLPSPRLSIPFYKLKGKCSTWREQNGYPIAKVKKYLESHNDFTNFFRIMLKNVGVRAHNVPLSYINALLDDSLFKQLVHFVSDSH